MTGWDLIGVFIVAGLLITLIGLLSPWEPFLRRLERWGDERSGDDAE